MGKTQSKTNEIEIPEELKQAAIQNLMQAQQVGSLPYAPNFGLTTAAFTPMQQAGFNGTNAAAGAFGMPTYGGPNSGMGMPKPQNVGGFSGYSTKGLYNDMLAKLPPGVKELYENILKMGLGGGGAAKPAPIGLNIGGPGNVYSKTSGGQAWDNKSWMNYLKQMGD